MEGKRFTLALICLVLVLHGAFAAHHQCKKGSDNSVPKNETNEFGECKRYQTSSCCSANYTLGLKNKTEKEHMAEWKLCKEPSDNCQKYILNEACFFHCDSSLVTWQTGDNGAVSMVPVCKSYCDAWFDACKDDKTCATNWNEDYNKTGDLLSCKGSVSSCMTYKELYKDGKGLCEKMWGKSFVYDEDDKDCMKMDFDGPNPNLNVSKPMATMSPSPSATPTSGTTRLSSVAVIYLVVLALVFKL